jgi:hypothetical protein
MPKSHNAKETLGVLSNSEKACTTEPENLYFPCPVDLCLRSFKTKKGLNVHLSLKHRDKCTQSGPEAPSQTGKRWSKEELTLLCLVEFDLRDSYTTSRKIHEVFVSMGSPRSLAALDRQRRNPGYKSLKESLFLKWDNEIERMSQEIPQAPPADANISQLIDTLRSMMVGKHESVDNSEQLVDNMVNVASQGNDVGGLLEMYFAAIAEQHVSAAKEPPKNAKEPKPLNRRDRAKLAYKRFQILYKKNRSKAANSVLDGKLNCGEKPENIPGFFDHWSASLKASEVPADVSGMARTSKRTYDEVWCPIQLEEVEETLKAIPRNKATGPDGVTVQELKSMPLRVLGKLLNLFLYNGKIPHSLKVSNTIFIPKKDEAKTPRDFRPISLTPMIVRLFNKIIAKRLLGLSSLDYRQRAFIPVDGCCENIMLLDHIITDAKKRRKNLFLANLDMNNAFGSVEHAAIFKALECNGAPQPLVEYVKDLFNGFTTNMVIGAKPIPVSVARGILQGDPLSPILFNMVIDQLLRVIPDGSGYELQEGVRADGMAFADDLVLLSSSKFGMDISLKSLEIAGGKWGLSFNSAKCSFLALIAERSKCVKVETRFKFVINGEYIRATKHGEPWRYLGAFFSSEGMKDAPEMLNTWLARLKKSMLKPQQRLYVLRVHLIPKLIFRLCMSKVSGRKLTKLDRCIRNALTGKKGILHLPGDTPVSFFHAPLPSGGLGLLRLRHSIPSMIVQRFSKFGNSDNEAIRVGAAGYSNSLRLKKAEALIVSKDNVEGLGAENIRKVNSALLHERIDGRGLKDASEVPYVHSWISDGTTFFDGRTFCDALKVRINAIPTKSRTNRGNTNCRDCRAGCQVPETNAHVFQRCWRTHGARIRRHDKVVSMLAKSLTKLGYKTVLEPVIRTEEGARKPDIVAMKDGQIHVIDPTICGEGQSADVSHAHKVSKYGNNPDIRKHLVEKYGSDQITFGSFSATYRGIVSRKSAEYLISLGVSKSDLRRMTEAVVEGTVKCFRWFMMSCEMNRKPLKLNNKTVKISRRQGFNL